MKKGRRPPAAGMGRKPGVPNKITTDLKEMILGALNGVFACVTFPRNSGHGVMRLLPLPAVG
jgi:hypothetical protein